MRTHLCRAALLTVVGALLAFPASALELHPAKDGSMPRLVDSKGMTVYYFTKDSIGKSACSGECLTKWPVVPSEAVKAETGLDPAQFGTITREDGAKQVTFRGYPLYTFFKDKMPGDINGQGVNSVWYTINPADFPPRK